MTPGIDKMTIQNFYWAKIKAWLCFFVVDQNWKTEILSLQAGLIKIYWPTPRRLFEIMGVNLFLFPDKLYYVTVGYLHLESGFVSLQLKSQKCRQGDIKKPVN